MKRNDGAVLALALTGIALTSVVVWGGFGSRGGDAVVLEAKPSPGAGLSIVWAGDTMVADASESFARRYGYSWPFANVADLLDADAVVVNHEAPLTTLRVPYNPDKLYSYSADPRSAAALKGVGVTALGLANNHAMDMGPAGLSDTLAAARQAGLACFGAGADDSEAERPLLIRNDEVSIGVVALGQGYGSSVTADRKRAGTIALSEASITRGYALARKAGADYVVGFVHWGENYEPQVLEEQRRLAADFAETGYDLVVGHGPHVPQRAEIVRGMPVVYSLGNFVFGTNGRFDEQAPGEGVVLRTVFTSEGLVAVSAVCLDTDNERVVFQPTPLERSASDALLERLGYASVIDVRAAELGR